MLTASELASRLSLRPATVLELARAGKIPSVRLTPKVVRFDIVDVISAMKRQKQVANVP
jgi:excisionase family DNA binding protein